jgi:hypothetical protein
LRALGAARGVTIEALLVGLKVLWVMTQPFWDA